VSYAFFVSYAGLVVAAIIGEPLIAGISMAFAAIVEASDILPESRRGRRLTDWRRGLDIRSQWRAFLFIIALAASSSPPEMIVWFAVFVLASGLVSRVMRSSALHLKTDLVLRPIGGMQTGVDRLEYGRRLARRRDMSELPIQTAGAFAALVLGISATVPDFGATPALLVATAAVLSVTAYAAGVAWQCRRLRPYLYLQHDAEVMAEFLEFDPEILCYFNGHSDSTYAVDVWLRTFEASGRRVGLVYRHSNVKSVDSETLPGIVVRKDADVESLVGPSTRIALYPANGTLNIHLQRDTRLAHVFIGHGDSDKSGSASPYTRSYDEVWVSGQAAIDRYAAVGVDIPEERFVFVGRPPLSRRVRDLAERRSSELHPAEGGAHPRDRLLEELDAADTGRRPPTILYAPTWEGYFDQSDYSSVAVMGLELITLLTRHFPGVRVIYKPHPMTGWRLPELAEVSEEIRSILEVSDMHHPAPAEHPGVDLYQWFDLSDLLITDVSSLLSDFMAWDRPYVVTNPSRMSTSLLHAEFPTTRSAYIVEPGSPTTRLVLGNALETDPLRASRSETRRYFLGDPDQDPLDLFNRAVDRLYEKTPTHSA
jgi:hypothetical protein